jgi:hypothetical protein
MVQGQAGVLLSGLAGFDGTEAALEPAALVANTVKV